MIKGGGPMLERLKSLGKYPKAILLLVIVMMLVFTVLYPVTTAREGLAYRNVILTPAQENGDTVYSGTIRDNTVRFTVHADQSVEFQYGDTLYGPYTLKEDPDAVPKDAELSEYMTGVELRCGEDVLFRGGVLNTGEHWLLQNADGSLLDSGVLIVTDDAEAVEPSAAELLQLMMTSGPEMQHKGEWLAWFCGMLLCVGTVVSILFVEELFQLSMSLRIRNAEQAEPSDWEIAGRYITWTVLPVAAMVIFVMGLL